jgi:subtilisin family serine protease
VCVLFLCAGWSVFAQSRPVRLRNETISATKNPAANAAKANAPARSGLYLIQFTGPARGEWLAQLRDLGVTVIQYVPDDAFIVRLAGVRVAQIEALPFVKWTGDFKPGHKIESRLAALPAGQAETPVSILLAPDATPAQQQMVRGLLNRVQSETPLRFSHIWRGALNPARLRALAESDAVLWIEAAPRMKLVDETAAKIIGGDSGAHPTLVQALGYDGSGVVVSVADSGLHLGDADLMHPDLFGRVDAFFFYGDLTDASDEHSHGTHVTGIIAGNGATGEFDDYGALWGLGVAPGVHVIAQRLFDGEGNYEAPPSFEVMTHDAVRAGADIGSNSWGDDTQGRYDISAMEFDALVRDADAGTAGDQPYILEFSAGNAGSGAQTVGSPAVAKNVIATGASQNDRFDYFIYAEGQDAMADFSSRGPCEDGRIKPDLVAPGTWIASLRSPIGNDEYAWSDISYYYLFQGGTSQAGPHASGAAAIFVQYYREQNTNATPSPALVKAALINSAIDMDDEVETGPTPNMDEGWGRIDLPGLIAAERHYDFVDQTAVLTNGQQFERRVVVDSADEPLVVTLAYTDVPGFPGALSALVNDLDLEVIAPDGQIFHGNQFDEGESIAGAPAYDSINNVEGVYVSFPLVGEYIVRVIARRVVGDARIDRPGVNQDFALVTSALMPAPGQGVVLLDRPAYTVPSRVNIRVVDTDLGMQATLNVTLKSSVETNGFAVTLRNNGFSGSLTGSVATATGAAANDGIIQITHGGWIRAEYLDASAGILRTGEAVGDLVGPVITGVTATNEFGQAVIRWHTDEPSTSIVRFNTNGTLSRAATNLSLITEHSVELTNLIVGRTYFFSVTSTDSAGNTTTNNSNGTNFVFVAASAATVLIVDAYTVDTDPGTPLIPVSAYTNALRQAGVSFDVLRVTNSSSSPNFLRLLPYQIVWWRINDSFNMGDTLSAQQQGVITQYLNAGGSFFMSSMELLSRLGSVPFRTNVFQISRFSPNTLLFESCAECDEDHGVFEVEGEPKDPISDGVLLTPDYSQYPIIDLVFSTFGPDLSDTFGVKRRATPIFYDTTSGEPCGVSFPRVGDESPGRVVFLSFPLDAIPEAGTFPNTRSAVLRRIMQFLVPGLDGIGTIAIDRDGYTIPDTVTIEVGDLDLAGQGTMTVQCHSSADTNRVNVTLTETARRGLFRGTVTLTNTAVAAGPGLVRANSGATVYAVYRDVSGPYTNVATAVIDLAPPGIFDVVMVPDYQSATVTWETTEITDALVEYGESPFLGHTVYLDDFDLLHELVLTGLEPDRQYFYRVTSRDAAGNYAVHDNAGEPLTFRTLVPRVPPFFEHFDGGPVATNWTVFNGEDSQTEWTLGVPNNGVETAAHSPPNAWGSSLNGGDADTIDTFLISPAIHLTGGNMATLTFVCSYDFSDQGELDLLQFGELLLFTNNSEYVTLGFFEDWSGGWETNEFNLSPYIGQVVYLVWHHQLLAFDSAPRPGWLVDDVTVVVSNIAAGTLRVTNNLSQASFVIDGPLQLTVEGTSYLNTNAPPGVYSVVFTNVPFWNTPAAVSNTLGTNATLVLTGLYTVTDVNSNGMADGWETNWFGVVSPGRTRYSDTDGDGLSDYNEFLAGTNPTNQASRLEFLNPVVHNIGVTRLDWLTVPGRSYRVSGSTDLVTWTPLHDWMRANGSILSFTAPSTIGVKFFRLEAKP